ncbi:hypothetical protein QUF95_17420 [Paenibacillus silvae]|uniref:hypothetical protein n=1 Tax=Paenibacillus silvae TaxID=1325358 RepID=UPI0025A1D239|nr:hypothetical protein [Paenibacillus silvae]MDM5279182.1 hypothetical protein [Paenibacillus silvae]
MNIKIGNKNKISKSNIGHQLQPSHDKRKDTKKNFIERHPVLMSAIVSFIIGFILLFSFWKNIILWLENLMK